jgi:hypothetical protein
MSITYRKSCKLTDRPPGYVTTAINESFNKTFKESFTKYIQSTVIDMFKTTLPSVCKYYSQNPKPDHKRKVVVKSSIFFNLNIVNTTFYWLIFNSL